MWCCQLSSSTRIGKGTSAARIVQDRALMEVRLDALRLNAEITSADNDEQLVNLRQQLASIAEERDNLRRAAVATKLAERSMSPQQGHPSSTKASQPPMSGLPAEGPGAQVCSTPYTATQRYACNCPFQTPDVPG
jgi:hypothetical protein